MSKALEQLLLYGVSDGYLSQPKFVYIPEVMLLAPKICPRVYDMVIRAVPSPTACCGFCSYAAIGATYIWQNDFNSFQKQDILEMLTKPRGEDCMDEYVMDIAGFDMDLQTHLQAAAAITIGNTEDAAHHFGQCLETMFHYGMVLEMNKLGLK